MKVSGMCLWVFLLMISTGEAKDFLSGLHEQQVTYDVVRDGTVIGRHDISFKKNQDQLQIVAETQINLSILFIPVYQFTYSARENWSQGILQKLDVSVDDDGHSYQIFGERDTETQILHITQKSGDQEEFVQIPDPIFTTNHWNSAVVTQTKVLNTLTGNINQVDILYQGEERLPNIRTAVKRYEYTGDLKDVLVWYSAEGNWVKLSFKAKDGSRIDYICRQCQG